MSILIKKYANPTQIELGRQNTTKDSKKQPGGPGCNVMAILARVVESH